MNNEVQASLVKCPGTPDGPKASPCVRGQAKTSALNDAGFYVDVWFRCPICKGTGEVSQDAAGGTTR
jgi:hypothetical protein